MNSLKKASNVRSVIIAGHEVRKEFKRIFARPVGSPDGTTYILVGHNDWQIEGESDYDFIRRLTE